MTRMTKLCISLTLLIPFIWSKALELDDNTIHEHVDFSKHALVMFYAPWCGHCKKMKPAFDETALEFASIPSITIAKIDADKHRSIGSKYGVRGFPTLHFFGKGLTEHVEYTGGRSKKDLVEYVVKMTGIDPAVEKEEGKVQGEGESETETAAEEKKKQDDTPPAAAEPSTTDSEPSSPLPNLDILDDDTLENLVYDGTTKRSVLVLFKSADVGDDVYKEMQKTKAAFAREPDVRVVAVDVAKAPKLKEKYGVNAIPLIKLFKYGETEPDWTVDFEEDERTADRLIEHINDYAGTFRVENGDLHEHAGLVLEFEQFARRLAVAVHEKKEEEKEAVMSEAESLANTVPLRNIHYYKDFFKSYIQDPTHLSTELTRLTQTLQTPTTPLSQKDWATMQHNIIESFSEILDHVKQGGTFTDEELGLVEPDLSDLGIDFESMGIDIEALMREAKGNHGVDGESPEGDSGIGSEMGDGNADGDTDDFDGVGQAEEVLRDEL